MKYHSSFSLELLDKLSLYKSLLEEEDFDFKTKDIEVSIEEHSKEILGIEISCNSFIELKIGTNAVLKSLEVIEKTLEITNG
jgi:hypothetical protein